MTLVFAIWTADGVVAAADGRTTELNDELSDDTNKTAVVPGQNIVVLLAGRARFPRPLSASSAGEPSDDRLTKAEICADLLEMQFGRGSDVRTEDVTVQRVAEAVQAHFAQLGKSTTPPPSRRPTGS